MTVVPCEVASAEDARSSDPPWAVTMSRPTVSASPGACGAPGARWKRRAATSAGMPGPSSSTTREQNSTRELRPRRRSPRCCPPASALPCRAARSASHCRPARTRPTRSSRGRGRARRARRGRRSPAARRRGPVPASPAPAALPGGNARTSVGMRCSHDGRDGDELDRGAQLRAPPRAPSPAITPPRRAARDRAARAARLAARPAPPPAAPRGARRPTRRARPARRPAHSPFAPRTRTKLCVWVTGLSVPGGDGTSRSPR